MTTEKSAWSPKAILFKFFFVNALSCGFLYHFSRFKMIAYWKLSEVVPFPMFDHLHKFHNPNYANSLSVFDHGKNQLVPQGNIIQIFLCKRSFLRIFKPFLAF